MKLVEFKIFEVAFEIAMNLIAKNEFGGVCQIGVALAEKGFLYEVPINPPEVLQNNNCTIS